MSRKFYWKTKINAQQIKKEDDVLEFCEGLYNRITKIEGRKGASIRKIVCLMPSQNYCPFWCPNIFIETALKISIVETKKGEIWQKSKTAKETRIIK